MKLEDVLEQEYKTRLAAYRKLNSTGDFKRDVREVRSYLSEEFLALAKLRALIRKLEQSG